MQTKDMTASNQDERTEYARGYDRGRGAGEQDRRTEIANRNRSIDDQWPLNARLEGAFSEMDEGWIKMLTEAAHQGYNVGYEHGFFDIVPPKPTHKPDKRIFGMAQILNPKNYWTQGFINVDTLAGAPLKKGDRCLAWQDGSDIDEFGITKYYAIPTGLTIDTGTVIQSVVPTGDLDENNELTGGGLVLPHRSQDPIRAYCGMVLESDQAIPAGATVEYLNVNGVNSIINRICGILLPILIFFGIG
jgi:hypothetical protein